MSTLIKDMPELLKAYMAAGNITKSWKLSEIEREAVLRTPLVSGAGGRVKQFHLKLDQMYHIDREYRLIAARNPDMPPPHVWIRQHHKFRQQTPLQHMCRGISGIATVRKELNDELTRLLMKEFFTVCDHLRLSQDDQAKILGVNRSFVSTWRHRPISGITKGTQRRLNHMLSSWHMLCEIYPNPYQRLNWLHANNSAFRGEKPIEVLKSSELRMRQMRDFIAMNYGAPYDIEYEEPLNTDLLDDGTNRHRRGAQLALPGPKP